MGLGFNEVQRRVGSLRPEQKRAARAALNNLNRRGENNIEIFDFRRALNEIGNSNRIDFNEICGRIFG